LHCVEGLGYDILGSNFDKSVTISNITQRQNSKIQNVFTTTLKY